MHLVDALSCIVHKSQAEARGRGIRRIYLETGSGEAFEPALELYRRRGFESCGAFGDLGTHSLDILLWLMGNVHGGEIRFLESETTAESDGSKPILVAGEDAGLELPFGFDGRDALVAIGMFRGSGAMDLLTAALRPVLGLIGFPPELFPLAILRSLTGSG